MYGHLHRFSVRTAGNEGTSLRAVKTHDNFMVCIQVVLKQLFYRSGFPGRITSAKLKIT